ncbi:hypothetical protein HAX54_029174 [Datura stramonium]|uniref:Uncharacterized protein n=1 Tax=Datura stramonium TaxID=4076 RepID=A0ABS8SA47_DATST|nr:hypothetical protein [Datura stramonium]
MASSTDGSSNSSMETAHSSLSHEDELVTGPSYPQKEVDLSSLISDIQGRADDLVPLADLKKSVRKWVRLAKGHIFASKVPYVSGPAFCTRARRPDIADPSTVPPSSPVPKTRSRVKPFSERKLLKGKMVFPSTTDSCLTTLWSKIKAQGWTSLFTDENAVVAKPEVIDFFKHFSISRGCITSRVGSILVVFNAHTLASKLGIANKGFATCQKNKWQDLPPSLIPLDIVRKFSRDPSGTSVSKFFKNSMFDYHRYFFAFVIKNLIPRQERRDVVFYLDLTLMEFLDQEMPINFPELIIAYLTKVVTNVQQNHALPYGSHPEDRKGRSADGAGTSQSLEVGEVENFHLENASLRLEIEQLKAQLVKNEETTCYTS